MIDDMIRAIALIVIGGVSFTGVYWATGPSEVETPAPRTVGSITPRAETAPSFAAVPVAATPATAMSAAATSDTMTPDAAKMATELRPGPGMHVAQQDGPAKRIIRDVTPEDMTAAPPVSAPLVRVEAPAKPEQPRKARTERLFNPIVVAAGSFLVGERKVSLAGIAVTEPETTCGEGAKAWPCGRLARAALRNMIRSRAIECAVPEGADGIPDPARCTVAGEDIGAWLVAQGWAKPSDDYDEEAKKARDSKIGLFADARPDAQPGELAARR